MKKYPNVYKDSLGNIFVKFSVSGKAFFYRTDKGKPFKSFAEAYNFVLLKKMELGSTKEDVETVPEFNDVNFWHKSFEDYIIENFKDTTAYCYIVKVRRIYKFFDNVSVFDRKSLSIINKSLNGTKDPSRYIYFGNMYLDHLYREGFVNKIIEYKFYRIKKEIILKKKDIPFWDYDEFKKFFKKIDNDYYRCLFSCLYFYGLRIGELLGLRWVDVDKKFLHVRLASSEKTFEKGRVLTSTKTQSSVRDYPMFDFIWSYLKKIKHDGERIFLVGETTIRRYLLKYIRAAHVKKISLHGFRHSCASYLINNGADYMAVCAWLGHSSPAVTLSTYSHIFPSKKNEIVNYFNKLDISIFKGRG